MCSLLVLEFVDNLHLGPSALDGNAAIDNEVLAGYVSRLRACQKDDGVSNV